MDLRQLQTFAHIARLGSFSQTAARLGYVQSTVSAQIQGLERELGVRLFDRLGRTVALTPAGRALLPHVRQMLDQWIAARSALAAATAIDGELSGSVTVSAPESLVTYRLPALLSLLRTEHPAIKVELRPTAIGRFRGTVRRAVEDGAVDAALVLDTLVDVPGVRAKTLLHETISVIAAPTHRLARSLQVRPKDLDGDAVLLPEAPDSGCVYRDQFERQLAERHINMGDSLEFASIEAVKQCVIAGMGVSVLPSIAVEADVHAGRLVRLAWQEPFEAHTQVVWNARRSTSPILTALIAAASQTFRAPESAGAAGAAG